MTQVQPKRSGQTIGAPGAPGQVPSWPEPRKDGIGCALSSNSRVWFTIADGDITEVYYPNLDTPSLRDMRFVVTDGLTYFAEEKTHMETTTEWIEEGVPAFRTTSRCRAGQCELIKTIYADTRRDCLIVDVAFKSRRNCQLYVVASPHLDMGGGIGNGVVLDDLRAEGSGRSVCMVASNGFTSGSCGYEGISDPLADLKENHRLTCRYSCAESGYVMLGGQIAVPRNGEFQLAVGFGKVAEEACRTAKKALLCGSEVLLANYIDSWREARHQTSPYAGELSQSLAVIRSHCDGAEPYGAFDTLGAPFGDPSNRKRLNYVGSEVVLNWMVACQDNGMIGSIEETATALLHTLRGDDYDFDITGMIVKAARFVASSGPLLEDGRCSPKVWAKQIAALCLAAHHLEERGDEKGARLLYQTADAGNLSLDRALYVTMTPLATKLGIEGYYVTRDSEGREVISTEALALVRYGLRAPDDPRILNTVEVIDHVLKKETETGPVWLRYFDDTYGERRDGTYPKDGQGRGHGWTVATLERAIYELARGDDEEAVRLLKLAYFQSGGSGFLAEQIFDGDTMPQHSLYNGRPTTSGMPSVTAHIEALAVIRSLEAWDVIDRPKLVFDRYVRAKARCHVQVWTDGVEAKCSRGKVLRIHTPSRATVRWSADEWQTSHDLPTDGSLLGLHHADLPTHSFESGTKVEFTFHWSDIESWEGKHHLVEIR